MYCEKSNINPFDLNKYMTELHFCADPSILMAFVVNICILKEIVKHIKEVTDLNLN